MEQDTSRLRPAIAMIELIFALVIMGIIMASAPLLISTATKSGYVTMQQEAINEAATQINIIMGYNWDESNSDESYLPHILNVTSGHADLGAVGTTGLRAGTPSNSERTFRRSDGLSTLFATIPASLGPDTADRDDVDDFIGDTNLTLIEASVVGDYIETTSLEINTTISYNSDTVTGGTGDYDNASITFNPFTALGGTNTSNIKEIAVTVTSSSGQDELDKSITLRAFSCNIGGYELAERSSF